MSLAALAERARAAWPGLRVRATGFECYLAERLPDREAPGHAARWHVGDLYLAFGCVSGAPLALAALERHFFVPLASALRRSDRSSAFVDEACQRLRERLLVGKCGALPRLSGYSGRGPLAGWLHVAAIRVALNLHRCDRADLELTERDEPSSARDPERELSDRRLGHQFAVAFADAVATLTVADRRVLRLHFLDGLPLARIGAVERVDKSTVSRRLQAVRRALRDETRRLLRLRLGLGDGELRSLILTVEDEPDIGRLFDTRSLG